MSKFLIIRSLNTSSVLNDISIFYFIFLASLAKPTHYIGQTGTQEPLLTVLNLQFNFWVC